MNLDNRWHGSLPQAVAFVHWKCFCFSVVLIYDAIFFTVVRYCKSATKVWAHYGVIRGRKTGLNWISFLCRMLFYTLSYAFPYGAKCNFQLRLGRTVILRFDPLRPNSPQGHQTDWWSQLAFASPLPDCCFILLVDAITIFSTVNLLFWSYFCFLLIVTVHRQKVILQSACSVLRDHWTLFLFMGYVRRYSCFFATNSSALSTIYYHYY